MVQVIDLTLDEDTNTHHGNSSSSSSAARTAIHPTPLPDLRARNMTTVPSITRQITKLPAQDHRTLVKKQTWLQNNTLDVPPNSFSRPSPRSNVHGNANPVQAALVFAQQEAGTAVCISPSGILLTCSHCVAEDIAHLTWSQIHWLIFSSGEIVAAKTIAWDATRDLALLVIIKSSSQSTSFPYAALSATPPQVSTRLICIGHPAAEDLEAPLPGTKTGYDTLVLSTGTFRGLADQDPQDNSNIGALMHSCWTYWGHSGAPLVDRRSGDLVGLHSSWDDQTGMRRGVPLEALTAFLDEVVRSYENVVPNGWTWYV